MTVGEYFDHFFNGAKGMTSIAIVVGFGLMLSDANRGLGLFDILINGIGGTLPACLIPPLAFVLVALTVFAVGGCWRGCAADDRRRDERHHAGIQPVLLRRRRADDHRRFRRIQHHQHQSHDAVCHWRIGAGHHRLSAVRADVKSKKETFRRGGGSLSYLFNRFVF